MQLKWQMIFNILTVIIKPERECVHVYCIECKLPHNAAFNSKIQYNESLPLMYSNNQHHFLCHLKFTTYLIEPLAVLQFHVGHVQLYSIIIIIIIVIRSIYLLHVYGSEIIHKHTMSNYKLKTNINTIIQYLL